MKKERVVRASEIMGFSPPESGGSYISKLLVDSEGVGSTKLMIVHATLKPGTSSGHAATHPPPYDEAYYVLQGRGIVEFGEDGDESYEIEPDMAVFIPAGIKHRIANTCANDLVFLGIWPMHPEPGVNEVYDLRKEAWGKTFCKVSE